MLERILTADQQALLARERQVLGDLRALLARLEAPATEQATLRESIAQLDELFLLVVVGEFNAGKSAVLNVLLGVELLAEGVTPTTSEICLLRYGEQVGRSTRYDGLAVLTAPVDLLREINLVDTPGTNAIDRRHEALTEEFVPRSDLILFVTSADRPFTESERAFLERLRSWGKKVVVVLNKTDILDSEEEVGTVRRFIEESAKRLLGFDPEVFPVSAKSARRGGVAAARDSGFGELEAFVRSRLDAIERLRLKLLNPVGVGSKLVQQQTAAVDLRLEVLAEDVVTLEDLTRQLDLYREDMTREFQFRLGAVEKILHQLENRGVSFFDDTLRLLRVPDLLNRSRLELEFERQVVADAPDAIEGHVSDIIDWMVESEHRQWQAVMEHVRRRRDAHGERVLGEVGGDFVASRRGLLESLGRRAQRAVETYDRREEATRLSISVQKAVAGTALLEAGAVGLGAAVTVVASTTAADVTGLLAAGTLAALGLFIIPARRRRAKATLRDRLVELRDRLMADLSEEFGTEIERSVHRIGEATGPYTRFVRSERQRLEAERRELGDIGAELHSLSDALETALVAESRAD